jgi:hypothetical protein
VSWLGKTAAFMPVFFHSLLWNIDRNGLPARLTPRARRANANNRPNLNSLVEQSTRLIFRSSILPTTVICSKMGWQKPEKSSVTALPGRFPFLWHSFCLQLMGKWLILKLRSSHISSPDARNSTAGT